jgi:hypothetical protein
MDSPAASGAPLAGWYPDYENPELLRYWDGTGWSAHTQPRTPAQPQPAQPQPAQPQPVQRRAPVQPRTLAQPQPVQPQPARSQPVQPQPPVEPTQPVRPAHLASPQIPARPAIPTRPVVKPARQTFANDWSTPASGSRAAAGAGQGARPGANPPHRRPRSKGRRAIRAVWLIAILVLGYYGTRYGLAHVFGPANSSVAANQRAARCAATQGAQLPKALSAAPRGRTVATPAEAKLVLKTAWTTREHALVNCNLALLDRLDTGSAKIGDRSRTRCNCLARADQLYSDSRIFLPRQTTYPAYFLAQARTKTLSGNSWTEIMVFTRASATAPWRLNLATGFAAVKGQVAALGQPVVNADGYAQLPDRTARAVAATQAPTLAAYYQAAKNTGEVPANPFQPSPWTTTTVTAIAAHRQDTVQTNGLRGHFRYTATGKDPVFSVLSGDQTLTCTVIRISSSYTGQAGQYPQQSADRRNWGPDLAPGTYQSITFADVAQTCFLAPVTGPALVLGGSPAAEGTVSGVPLS